MGHLAGDHLNTVSGSLGVMLSAVKSWAGHPEPVAYPLMLKSAMKGAFPDLQRMELLRLGEGERADYAFLRLQVSGTSREVFVKYRPADDFSEKHFKRFLNEIQYLRDFAPLLSIPHAALLGYQQSEATLKAHLILESLEDRCMHWSDLPEPERFNRVHQVMRLMGEFHAQWMLHPALKQHPSAPWGDQIHRLIFKHRSCLQQGREDLNLSPELLRVADHLLNPGVLEGLFAEARKVTLCHGDFHFGQVMVDRLNWDRLYLIDYEHSCVSPVGFDLAHFLVIRFNWFERTRLEHELLQQYLQVLHQHGIALSQEELYREYRVGILHNFLLMWARYQREPEPMFHELLNRLFVALQEHQVLQPEPFFG
ncbi:phosphotransferase family protein [Deinococcus cellulosilyticus]|uniref:CHK kinase-like domain-containing protein n=1 Tax=Deinococcus cellulosilyticus (strain DSM 18568 / NBRC 106333 / KACC 11606 / 5516J-15) TaxID=1223518 RepID=A0A511N7P1_DEIC1|nr:phosphotransferase [Deinococcus cellulosilyticus]GEM48859.1 hypothetical protein DC3_44940 [Deinococcus cellulosilyticus NBRC 106333 = KACC 11606]